MVYIGSQQDVFEEDGGVWDSSPHVGLLCAHLREKALLGGGKLLNQLQPGFGGFWVFFRKRCFEFFDGAISKLSEKTLKGGIS